ncbi:MAG TPA: hypothetical protein VLM37_05490 [Fibrobacteraceae bacterium]|nr:hypothetical protein [Fibrobacteraceae bacterium]
MLKNLTIRITSTAFAAGVLALYVFGALLLVNFEVPLWALLPYLWLGATSLVIKMHFVGIPGSHRFHQGFLN